MQFDCLRRTISLVTLLVSGLTALQIVALPNLSLADDLPGNSGGTSMPAELSDPPDWHTAHGGMGNGYGGGGGGGMEPGLNFGGEASENGVGGDGASSDMGGIITQGGKGGDVKAVTVGLNPINLKGMDGEQGVNNTGSGGGGGGAGVFLGISGVYVLGSSSSVVGGSGGMGGSGFYQKAAGGGGGGGAGIVLRGAMLSISSGVTVVGGVGGAGGPGTGSFKAGGGAGGDGVVLQSGSLTNIGTVTGGAGGGDSNNYADVNPGSSGGTGGSGVFIKDGAFVNKGSVTGGVGGPHYQHGVQGASGSGVRVDANAYIINEGSISSGGNDANAIDILGDNNTFEIWNGSTITGNVVVNANTTGNRFVLGGVEDSSFDTSAIGDAVQYRGFDNFEKTGTGTWTLTGSTQAVTAWKLSEGTLSVSSDANLGDAAGGLTLDGGALQVTSTQYTSTNRTMTLGSHGGGFDIVDAGNTFSVTQTLSGDGRVWKRGDGTLLLSGDNSFSGGLTVEKGTAQAGVADHAFGSGVLTVNGGAKADLANFNTTVGGLAGAGDLAMGSGNLAIASSFDTLFSGIVDGSGALTKTGTGTQTLSGANTYSGATNVNGGTLKQGAAGAFNATSSGYSVGKSGTLDLGGFTTSLATLSNDGHVNFGGNGGATLNVAGNYAGNGGMVTINTVLGGDGSRTDLLKVGGDTSGSTKLYVNNADGAGAQTVNGIKVVDIGGHSGGTFSLANSYTTKDGQQAVVGGAYAYTLQEGSQAGSDDGNWYLTSSLENPKDPTCADANSCPPPRYSAGAPVYEGYAQNMLALNKLPTLQQRVGNRYWAGENGSGADNGAVVNNDGVWARVEGAHNRLEPDTSTSRMKQDINTLTMQAGVDGQFYESEQGRLIAGITGQYGHAKGDVSSTHGDGDISTDAWSLGATATWYGNDGLYVDGQSQVTWFDNDLNSWTADTGLANGRKATGYALSMEAGQRVAIDQNWSLTPQAQLMWSSIDADAFHDTWNARVSLHDGDSLTGRIGLAANYRNGWKGDDGLMVNTTVYGIANLYQQFLGGTTVNISGVDFDTDNDRTWGGVGAGGTYAWADNKYALYGEGSINTSLNNFADSYALKATVGFRTKW